MLTLNIYGSIGAMVLFFGTLYFVYPRPLNKLIDFSPMFPLYIYSLKTSENERFSDIFVGYRKGTLD